MTLKDFLEKHSEVEITKEQEEQIKNFLKIKESKRWKPNDGEEYYYIDDEGSINYHFFANDEIDNFLYFSNNCFQTKEEAEFHLEKLKVYYELKNFADENNEEIDWKNIDQIKYTFLFDYEDDKIVYDNIRFFKRIGSIYFSSKELAKQAIAKVGEDRIKKYLFGVENE